MTSWPSADPAEAEDAAEDAADAAVAGALLDRLPALAAALRTADVPVSLSELVDAAQALVVVDLADRRLVKAALRATLVKRVGDVPVFDALFDRCFAPPAGTGPAARPGPAPGSDARPAPAADRDGAAGTGGPSPSNGRDDVLDALREALDSGDDGRLRAAAAAAVAELGGLPARGHGPRHHLARVLRALDLEAMDKLLRSELREAAGPDGGLDAWARLADLARLLDLLEQLLAGEVAARLAGDGGEVAASPSRADELTIQGASSAELAEISRVIAPLARTLAARLARERRARRQGRLDMRRTLRRSLGAGGVPLDPAFRRRRASRPELVVLADVSGSVAEFSAFTLLFLRALHREFRLVRSFVFVDRCLDVTAMLERADHRVDTTRLAVRPDVSVTHRSDYGAVLNQFRAEHLAGATTARSTVLITGDGRSHGRDPAVGTLAGIARSVRRVYWLNPEPRRLWDVADSVVGRYEEHLDGLYEVRNLAELADCIARLA